LIVDFVLLYCRMALVQWTLGAELARDEGRVDGEVRERRRAEVTAAKEREREARRERVVEEERELLVWLQEQKDDLEKEQSVLRKLGVADEMAVKVREVEVKLEEARRELQVQKHAVETAEQKNHERRLLEEEGGEEERVQAAVDLQTNKPVPNNGMKAGETLARADMAEPALKLTAAEEGRYNNLTRAKELYDTAMRMGSRIALTDMGFLMAAGTQPEFVKPNSTEGAVRLKRAAMADKSNPIFGQPSADAAFYLGSMAMEGDGIPRNFSLGFEMFKRAAAQGHRRARFEIGWMHSRGGRCEQAVKAWKQVAEDSLLPHVDGARGHFESGDMFMALLGYLEAAEQGSVNGQVNAAWLLEQQAEYTAEHGVEQEAQYTAEHGVEQGAQYTAEHGVEQGAQYTAEHGVDHGAQ
jgi:TPR repeat protein